MYTPDEMARTARTNNFEAMALMKDSKRHTVSMRQALYEILQMDISIDVRNRVIIALRESDQAVTAADAAVHWLFENELLHVKKARRGKYKKVKDGERIVN